MSSHDRPSKLSAYKSALHFRVAQILCARQEQGVRIVLSTVAQTLILGFGYPSCGTMRRGRPVLAAGIGARPFDLPKSSPYRIPMP